MADPSREYKEWVLENLPSDITIDPIDGFFIHNGHKFPTFLRAKWYKNYISKHRNILSYQSPLNELPALVVDFSNNFYGASEEPGFLANYQIDSESPNLVTHFATENYGTT